MASVWTRLAIITAYISIWVIYFIDSMQQSNSGALKPYVTSAFQSHSLTPTVGIFSSIIGGLFKLTLAKVLDVFGCPRGYLLSIIFPTMGLVMMAGCNGVKKHAAAQVFYWVGSVLPLYIHTRYNGVDFSLHIFTADTSALKNRGLMIAYASSPYIITTWITGYMTTAFLKGPGFRWGYGVFCIVTPAVTLPRFGLFMHYYYKAKHIGLVPKRESNRKWWESLYHYARERSSGRPPIIICFFVFGGLLIIAIALWEKFFAPAKFLPYHLLTDRTAVGSSVLVGAVFVSFYCRDACFFSFSLPQQLSYPWGPPERIAIQESYDVAQKMVLITGTATLAVVVVLVLVWRDYDVGERKQVRGRVI
ncbi:hypothetical protein LRP88_07035 [Fusarium phalaenopsidis]